MHFPSIQLLPTPWAMMDLDKGLASIMDDNAKQFFLGFGINDTIRAVEQILMHIAFILRKIRHALTAVCFLHPQPS